MRQQEVQALKERLAAAREELTQAQAALPAHSVRPWQFARLEEAEEAVARLEARLKELDES